MSTVRAGVERAACGVGFVASRRGEASHGPLAHALQALSCMEHRGACAADRITGDGAGVMAEIPWGMLGYARGHVAVASLLVHADGHGRTPALDITRDTFAAAGLSFRDLRQVPIDEAVLGPQAREDMPRLVQAIIRRPPACRTSASFNARLYEAKQQNRTRLGDAGLHGSLYFASLSTTTIVYKALTRAADLVRFYPDLQDARFTTRFALFHRRFSTNTKTSWDKAQPFRLIAHNGEINTIAGNRSWSVSREQALGLNPDELLTHHDISDSGSLNEMVEALRYRSSIPHLEDALALLMPPALPGAGAGYYAFWGRAVEPWDGPAFITFSDGETVGARLDRNGFRPCRWAETRDTFFLASEAGAFALPPSSILAKGTLHAGSGVTLELESGELHLTDPSVSRENAGATFDARLVRLEPSVKDRGATGLGSKGLFGLTEEGLERVLVPMVLEGKEPIGSMGDTARPAILSAEPRSFFDFFYQDFAQVTNPPLDYLRESLVTDLSMHLGVRPNVFQPKELIPPAPAIGLDSPVLSLGQMAALRALNLKRPPELRKVRTAALECVFDRAGGPSELGRALDELERQALAAVAAGACILLLGQRKASLASPPIPSLLALRAVVNALNAEGLRLRASVVVEAGDVHDTHALAALVGFGANAVCPFLALELARYEPHSKLTAAHQGPDERETTLLHVFEAGLLKVMSKMGISVVRSYQSAKLFTALGLGPGLIERYFSGLDSPIGGIELEQVAERVLRDTEALAAEARLVHTYQLKEHPKGLRGERHAMTAVRAKQVHRLVRAAGGAEADVEADVDADVDADAVPAAGSKDPSLPRLDPWAAYKRLGEAAAPVELRHLLQLGRDRAPVPMSEVEPREAILRTFGAGAMSFGAISAEAQRDLIHAMRTVGGRSNSGEGGKNPYYFVDGTTASTKQVASARFGVDAEYLAAAEEIEIKIAQGAKPGEGGQLMGVKVDAAIARARHATAGVTLISPPPLHDIYSIEDLKQLIYELRAVRPGARICVKLVAGTGIGTIAVGVVKAGADVVQISGGNGGTGAAAISSMKHAGLPWELGLVEAHRALLAHHLRHQVVLRVDGGLHDGEDVVLAAALGAEEFGFGKLLLVAEGCIMARICEKNRCPTGIATHNPKFKAKYRGSPEHVVAVLEHLADDAREALAAVGARSLREVVGRMDLLAPAPRHAELVAALRLDLGLFLRPAPLGEPAAAPVHEDVGPLEQQLVAACAPALERGAPVELDLSVSSTDRAVLARLSGLLAAGSRRRRVEAQRLRPGVADHEPYCLPDGTIRVRLTGSAGQGFAAFLVGGVDVRLRGEANDSVAKAMSGGRVVITPPEGASFVAEESVIIGNCAAYGATGGRLYVHGLAGDRFCVRNSGATAVVEGAGLHACEYMTGGQVLILGAVSHNVGAGMTGGVLWLRRDRVAALNAEYVAAVDPSPAEVEELHRLLADYEAHTGSRTAQALLADAAALRSYVRVLPVAVAQAAAPPLGAAEAG